MRTTLLLPLLALSLIPAVATAEIADPGELYRSFLSTDAIHADAFLRKHPEWDGRGIVIAVLDTGVDMGIPGLLTTSTGETKVIVARDFSGQGEVTLEDPEVEETPEGRVLRAGDHWVTGFEALLPGEEEAVWKLGALRESSLQNGAVRDLNNNGSTGDVFSILARPGENGQWVAHVDTDGDHDVSDEKPIHSYSLHQESFVLRGGDPAKKTPQLHMALHIDDDGARAEVHFDDGGHGTHVAGIAAGHRLQNKDGFHGIAPGAKVMSLKIGNNALAGGATTTASKKKALRFAADWARDNDRIVVMNMSYGIGSEIEGDSDIDRLLTEILAEVPWRLSMSTSAGNAGPGLSSVGQPAASELAFTAAAALTRQNAIGLFGSDIGTDRLFAFSSRGGELAKPTATLPGVAASTVPAFMGGDIMAGTSMAAPQGAGAHALLLSAAQSVGIKVHNGMLRRALRQSARPLKGYTPLDQGGGMVHVPRAFKLLRSLAGSPEAAQVLGYKLSTESPLSPDGESPAAYWRTGTYVPPRHRPQTWTVKPIFPSDTPVETRESFYAAYRLESDVNWLVPESSKMYLRGDGSGEVTVTWRPEKLRNAGLHVGRIFATPAGGPSGRRGAAFELIATAIIAETFTESNAHTRRWADKRLAPCEVSRHFVLVPPGATRMQLDLTLDDDTPGWTRLEVFQPDGHRPLLHNRVAETAHGGHVSVSIDGERLIPGTWEVDIYASFRNRTPVKTTLEARFDGLTAEGFDGLSISAGEEPSAVGTVVNQFNRPFHGYVSGEVDSFEREEIHDVEGDTMEIPFSVDSSVQGVSFELTMDPWDYAKFTDVAVNILDASGQAVSKGGFSSRRTTVSLRRAAPGSYRLELIGALTHPDGGDWSVSITERHHTRDKVAMTMTHNGDRQFSLHPHIPADLELTLSSRPRMAPDGFSLRGQVRFHDAEQDRDWLSLPIRFVP